jgi:benzylsuccinate CoA-transferase BbsF subunit
MDALRPLAGIRVVDFCWIIAGPLGTRLMASFGAEVIRIESRSRMDSLRGPMESAPRGQLNVGHYLHHDVDAGKRSITVDVTTERGRELIRRLIDSADIVANNFRPGALERMGFGYDELKRTNPGIILINMPGNGHMGPWAEVGTLGNLVMAASGMNSLSGFPGRPPSGVGVAYPDFTSPYLLALTVAAALRERSRTGSGQQLHLSQLSAMISLLGVEWMQFTSSGQAPTHRANRDPNYCPHGVYPTLGDDEWCAIAVQGDEQWRAFCDAIGEPELATDQRFSAHDARKRHEDDLDAVIVAWTAARDRWEVADLLQELGIAAAAVENLRDVLEVDPQLRDHFQHVSEPSKPDADMLIDGEAIRFVGVDRPLTQAPALGEDNEHVLCEIVGLSREQFDALVVEGVIN